MRRGSSAATLLDRGYLDAAIDEVCDLAEDSQPRLRLAAVLEAAG